MHILNIFAIILLFIALTSCREEIALPVSNQPAVLIVDGQITNEYKQHEIRLTQSGDYRQDDGYPTATGALVTVSDGQQTFDFMEQEPGVYISDSLAGIPGRLYRLEIRWEGQTYAAQDTMGEIPPAFESNIFVKQGKYNDFEYRRHQFGFPEPHQWQVILEPTDSSHFLTQPASQYGQQVGITVEEPGRYIFTYFTHPNIEVNGLLNFEEPHFYGFHPGRLVIHKRFSLSQPYYQFLRAVFMETEWRGTLFDTTPANVPTNVSSGGKGYFSACAVREVRYFME